MIRRATWAAACLIGALAAPAMANGPKGAEKMKATVEKKEFGKTKDGTAVDIYTLTNANGMKAKITNYGGIITELHVPDRDGKLADVVLGFKTLNDYVTMASPPPPNPGGPYFGEIVGRYGNRIAKGTFQLDGHTYTLPINNGVNSLHGGFVGFGNHVWAPCRSRSGARPAWR